MASLFGGSGTSIKSAIICSGREAEPAVSASVVIICGQAVYPGFGQDAKGELERKVSATQAHPFLQERTVLLLGSFT